MLLEDFLTLLRLDELVIKSLWALGDQVDEFCIRALAGVTEQLVDLALVISTID